MSALFAPLRLRDLTLANRIVVSPMCQYVALDGRATDWHHIHLGGLAQSGAGLLCIEATAVEPDGRITPGDLGLWDERTEAALQPVLETIRRHSPVKVAIQLAHAGRKASSRVPWQGGSLIAPQEGGWRTVGPSAVPQKDGETPPEALDDAGLERLRRAFAEAARRAERLGLDAIEIHGAHGYLLHEFLSPLSNRRTDDYGGSPENRFRFPLEIFDIVRSAFPAGKPVGVKLSATDWMPDGWDLEQTISFSRTLKARGADWVTLSSGGISQSQIIPVGPGYQIPFAESVKRDVGIATVAVGLITEGRQAESIVAGGKSDLVAVARGMLYDPRWGWHAAAALGEQVAAAPSYWRAPPHEQKGLFAETTYGTR